MISWCQAGSAEPFDPGIHSTRRFDVSVDGSRQIDSGERRDVTIEPRLLRVTPICV